MADPQQGQGAASSGAITAEQQLEAAADRIRSTAKWLVASFGAVAAALIAGLQLSDLGKIDGTDQAIAAIGAGVALVAVVLIVAIASGVLAAGRLALSDLTGEAPRRADVVRELNRTPVLYLPASTLDGFADRIKREWEKQTTNWDLLLNAPDEASRAKAQEAFDDTKRVLPGLNRLNTRLLAVARYEDVRLRFQRARAWIVGLALLAALGAGAFAFASSTSESAGAPAAAVEQRPVAAIADLNEEGEQTLRQSIGRSCDLDRLAVIALSSSERGWEVITLPRKRCHLQRLILDAEQASVRSASAVELDLPDP